MLPPFRSLDGGKFIPASERAKEVPKDGVVCGAVAGFSLTEKGVALRRELSGYKIVIRGLELAGERAVWASTPRALVIAVLDGRETHVALADFAGLRVPEPIYRKKPANARSGTGWPCTSLRTSRAWCFRTERGQER